MFAVATSDDDVVEDDESREEEVEEEEAAKSSGVEASQSHSSSLSKSHLQVNLKGGNIQWFFFDDFSAILSK